MDIKKEYERWHLTGSHVRDKDGVDGAYMICEMFSYYATKGISLLDTFLSVPKTEKLLKRSNVKL